jgi:aspartate aminotransferase-like enzyme
VTTLAFVVTVDLEGQLPKQLLRAVQCLDIVIKAQFVFEGGEETLRGAYGRVGHMAACIARPQKSDPTGG